MKKQRATAHNKCAVQVAAAPTPEESIPFQPTQASSSQSATTAPTVSPDTKGPKLTIKT